MDTLDEAGFARDAFVAAWLQDGDDLGEPDETVDERQQRHTCMVTALGVVLVAECLSLVFAIVALG